MRSGEAAAHSHDPTAHDRTSGRSIYYVLIVSLCKYQKLSDDFWYLFFFFVDILSPYFIDLFFSLEGVYFFFYRFVSLFLFFVFYVVVSSREISSIVKANRMSFNFSLLYVIFSSFFLCFEISSDARERRHCTRGSILPFFVCIPALNDRTHCSNTKGRLRSQVRSSWPGHLPVGGVGVPGRERRPHR